MSIRHHRLTRDAALELWHQSAYGRDGSLLPLGAIGLLYGIHAGITGTNYEHSIAHLLREIAEAIES